MINEICSEKKLPENFQKKLEGNDDCAAFELAERYRYGWGKGFKRNLKKAVHYYHLATKGNSPLFLHHLGTLYFNGEICFPANYKVAAELFQKASKLGWVEAQEYLGYMFNKGLGLTKNKNFGLSYYKKAAHSGVISAMVKLGKQLIKERRTHQLLMDGYSWLKAGYQGVDDYYDEDRLIPKLEKKLEFLFNEIGVTPPNGNLRTLRIS